MPSHVRVVVRTRPTNAVTDNFKVLTNNTVCVTRQVSAAARAPKNAASSPFSSLQPSQETLTFHADAVLHNASQEATHEAVAAELVESVLQGVNCTFLCYGQSGSGKTYTLFGGETYPTRGCVPRAIQSLFHTIATSTEREFKVALTFVEIQGEQLVDLLGRGGTLASNVSARHGVKNENVSTASVFTDSGGKVMLRGVERRECHSEEEVLTAVFEGLQRRLSGLNPHCLHRSRSHVLLSLYVVSKSLVDSDAVTHHSQCNFVDLAGSDRPHSLTDEAAQQESKVINRSLMMLEQVVFALSGNRNRHVPYRQSKLTMLLKDSIGGDCRTTIVANVWPEQRNIEATLATLNFAKRVSRIDSNPTPHFSMDQEAQIKMLQKQVNSLKSELRMQDQLAGREAVATAPLESDEIQIARERVMAFVDGITPQVRVNCVRDMNACFLAFKAILAERDAQLWELESQLTSAHRPDSSTSARGGLQRRKASIKHTGNTEKKEQVRILSSVTDGSSGIGVGTTDKPSLGLRDILLQQSHHSSGGQVTQTVARNKSVDETTVHIANPTGAAELVASAATGTAASTTHAVSAAVQKAPTLSFLEDDVLQARPRNQVRLCSVKESGAGQDVIFPPVERNNTLPAAAKSLKRPEGDFRDKRVAFESYKWTSSGMCQLESIKNAQQLVEEKNKLILELQKRVGDIKADIGTNKLPEKPLGATTHGASNEAVTPSLWLSEGINSSLVNNAVLSDAPPVSSTEDFRNMTDVEKKAFLNFTTDALTRAVTERSILMNQLNRHYEAFMSNFNYWYNSHAQHTVPQQGERTAGTNVDVEGKTAVKNLVSSLNISPRPAQQTDGDLRFIDNGERFEDMELLRQVQKDPESMTFYAAQRTVRRGK